MEDAAAVEVKMKWAGVLKKNTHRTDISTALVRDESLTCLNERWTVNKHVALFYELDVDQSEIVHQLVVLVG